MVQRVPQSELLEHNQTSIHKPCHTGSIPYCTKGVFVDLGVNPTPHLLGDIAPRALQRRWVVRALHKGRGVVRNALVLCVRKRRVCVKKGRVCVREEKGVFALEKAPFALEKGVSALEQGVSALDKACSLRHQRDAASARALAARGRV